MKTYNEYLQIIKDREYIEGEPERLRQAEQHKKHGDNYSYDYFVIDGTAKKMTIDYSIEIMGMMMQDFLNELHDMVTTGPLSFDENGRLKVTTNNHE